MALWFDIITYASDVFDADSDVTNVVNGHDLLAYILIK